MAFDVQTLASAATCAQCLSPNQKQDVALYLLNEILQSGGAGGTLHNLLSLTHPDTVPGPPLRGSLIVGNATPDWEALLIGPANRVLRSDGVDVSWSQLVLTTDVTGILPVANGGTGTSTAFTQGSVIFAGAGGIYTQDNANLFFDNANNRLGVATATPLYTLHVLGPGSFQYGFAAGALLLGADLNATTVSVNSRKVGRVNMVSYDGGAINTFLFGGDLQAGTNDIYFGGVTAGSQYAATAIHFFTGATQTTTGGIEKFTVNASGVQLPPTGAAAGNTGELRFLELAASGTSYTGFKAPDAMTASEIYVLPDAAPSANRFLRAAAVAGGVSALSWNQISLTADVTGILPVANGGSGTSTAFTQGSVIFAGAAGVFAQDNANLFWDDANNRLGLGTNTPASGLHVVDAASVFAACIIGGPSDTGVAVRLGLNYPNYIGALYEGNTYAGLGLVMRDNANQFTSIGGPIRFQAGAVNLRKNVAYTSKIDVSNEFRFTDDADLWSTPPGSTFTVGANTYTVRSSAPDRIRVLESIAGEAATGTLTGVLYAPIRMLVDTLGNVGIGTTALGVKLEISSAVDEIVALRIGSVSSGYNGGKIIFKGAAGIDLVEIQGSFSENTGTGDIFIRGYNGGIVDVVTIKGSGNVGISVTLPLARLHIVNSAAATIGCIIKAAAAQSANIMEWQSSAAAVLVCVDEAGSVGIGTASPVRALDVFSSSTGVAQIGNTNGTYLLGLSPNTAFLQTSGTIPFAIFSGGTQVANFLNSGNVGIGIISPTALLHLAAGTATASTAPLKFTTGTSLTTAEAGAMEFTTDDLFFTITTGAARKRLLMADATAGLTSGKMPIATTNGRLIDLTASAAYTPTNITTDRAFDADSTNIDELADVLGSLIADLQAVGILG